MKQICRKKWVRILAGILCVLSFNVAAGSFLGFAGMETVGVYDRKKEEVKKECFHELLRKYSIFAMSHYQDGFGMEELSKTNFRYGIIQTDSIEGLDFNDKSIYKVCNFDREVKEDELFVYSCNMGENTSYYAGKTLFDYSYIYNDDAEYQEVPHPIEACYFDRNTKRLYFLAEGKLYARNVEYVIDAQTKESINLLSQIQPTESQTTYEWKNLAKAIEVEGDMNYYLSDISIVTSAELKNIGEVMPALDIEPGYQQYYFQHGEVLTYDYVYNTSKPYFVLSYVNEPLETEGGYFYQGLFTQLAEWDNQDFFVQLIAILNLTYAVRYGIYIAMFLSSILFLVSLVIFMCGAGYEKSYDGIKVGYLDKIPYDVFLCLVFVIVWFLVAMSVISVKEMTLRFAVFICFFGVLGSEGICLRFIESTAIRFKNGSWWRNTLIVICLRFCKRMISGGLQQCRSIGKKLADAVPFLWKAWIIMGALAFLEFAGLLFTSYQPDIQLFCWFLEKVVLYGGLTICLLQLYKLQQGAKNIADGEMESHIDTTKMLWDFKAHGENLNRIREGIGKAVAERMKSERFKTELITNVSHDIKTPLTSIVNYVDLLEKEDIDNPKVQEYLEVLSRQSGRLKKLIEDLIEASKASTGNLAVATECCEAGVMLAQTVGEFEEKLKAGQIELMVQNCKESVHIQADPRHLWRIFDNLMNNICKYAQANTRAYVNIEKEGMQGKFIFRNISKYALNIDSAELMERFVRGDSSRNTEGNGLGLSIARSLTELMQGNFELVIDGDLFKVIVTFPITEKTDNDIT